MVFVCRRERARRAPAIRRRIVQLSAGQNAAAVVLPPRYQHLTRGSRVEVCESRAVASGAAGANPAARAGAVNQLASNKITEPSNIDTMRRARNADQSRATNFGPTTDRLHIIL